MRDRSGNKDGQVVVRLTPHQALALKDMSRDMDVNRSTIVRYALDRLIDRYEQAR